MLLSKNAQKYRSGFSPLASVVKDFKACMEMINTLYGVEDRRHASYIAFRTTYENHPEVDLTFLKTLIGYEIDENKTLKEILSL